LALGHNGLAANETRLMLFPIGVYVAVRLSNLTVRRFIEAAAVAAFGVAAFLIFQSSFLSTSFAAHYWGAPTFSVPATFIATGLTGARGAGTLASPNEAALAMAVWACMLAASLLVLRERMRWHALVLGVVLLALGLTFSRSAILATPVGLAFLAVGAARSIGFRQRQGIKLMVTAGVAVVAILVVVYAERGGIDLVRATFMSVTSTPAATTDSESPATPGVDSSTIAHANSLSYGWSVVQANPLGVGLGEVGYRVVPWTGERAKYVIESWYLTMGMSLGWAGFVWALLLPPVFFLLALAAIRRGRVLPGLALLGTSVAIGGICVLLPTMAEPQLAMLPWALAAFAVRPRSPASDDRLESGPIPAVAGAAQASTLS
jgi:hypothetical protein